MIRGPQRRPWQPPLPEPVIQLISSLVRTPASSTFQNTLFLMPLQMQTTFIPSSRVRAGGVSAAWLLSGHGDGAGEGTSASGCTEGASGRSVRAGEAESQSGPSKPMVVGSSPANPFFPLVRSGVEGFCPALKCFVSRRL